MQKVKSKVEKQTLVDDAGIFTGIRNHVRSRLILVGAPTQRVAHTRAKHLGRVTAKRVMGLVHA
jgi:hypothetical protein